MKWIMYFLFLTVAFSLYAETELGATFYQTPVKNGAQYYTFWGHIQKDKDDVLDHLIVRSYERPFKTSCDYFRNLDFENNVRFLSSQGSGSTFILMEPCNDFIVWIKGYVSSSGFISVLSHVME